MTCVTIVAVRMTIFKHENFVLDLNAAHKSILYKDNKLLFMGDGYKAILSMINNSKDQQPVKQKFSNQLNMREKPKFSKSDDALERLRREAEAAIVKTEKKPKRKRY